MSEWQPIETAPKDGTRILVYPHNMSVHWDFGAEQWLMMDIPLNSDLTISDDDDSKAWWELMANGCGWPEPTHWQPLPTPPQGDEN